MRAIIATPDATLALLDRPDPVPGPGEVTIRVHAAGVNRADLLQARGLYPPPPGASDILGLEVSGEIAALGPGVTEWGIGQPVCALLAGGAYADHVTADAGSVLPKPPHLTHAEAATLPEAVFTVFANVFRACGLKPGERILFHGATSGIGVIGVQMAALTGSEVFATAGNAEKCALAASLGARTVINYREADFEAEISKLGGVDVILDMVGGAYVQKNLNTLREGGRLANIAYQDGPQVSLNLLRVMLKRLWITGSTLRARSGAEKRSLRDGLLHPFWDMAMDGRIRPVLDSVFPLADAAAAHERMRSGAHSGKVVLSLD
jgi:putative PIG3 family NAD(P)H quinone oxidoreductase